MNLPLRLCVLASLLLVVSGAGVQAAMESDQSFVRVGEQPAADFEVPTILVEIDHSADVDLTADVEMELLQPELLAENAAIEQNTGVLAQMELLAHQLGAPVYSDIAAEKSLHEVEHIEHSLIAHDQHERPAVELLSEEEHLPAGLTSLLETAPITPAQQSSEDADLAAMEHDLAMVELGVKLSHSRHARPTLDKKNDYAFLDDPKHGGAPTVLKNLQGLDIYVVNTPIADPENEIRPVKPPHPMNAAMREKARLAALMRKQLIHDIPQPKAAIKPKTKINTLSAYESSLVPSKPLKKISRLSSRYFDHPMVGGMGAMQLKGVPAKKGAASARFQQLMTGDALPGTPDLPHFPKDPNAKPVEARAYGTGSSFDNRDGPPALLDDLLPLKATLVEELDPLHVQQESKPTGW